MENMDGAELLGKTIYCNFSKPQMKMQYGQAVWSNEEWIKKSLAEESHSLLSLLHQVPADESITAT